VLQRYDVFTTTPVLTAHQSSLLSFGLFFLIVDRLKFWVKKNGLASRMFWIGGKWCGLGTCRCMNWTV